jgi:energy-coupling factor transport system permease protein
MSTIHAPDRIDTRVWLVWGAAASMPLLTGRHPLVIAQVLTIVLVVRAVCLPSDKARGWSWLLRVAMITVPIGVLFNMLTVHAGNAELFRIPAGVPIFGGTVTWNAVAYGLLSGVTIVALIAIGTTVAAGMDWSALMRSIPVRASGIAMAGSVAWAFLPQMATSWREIREAQAARGHQWRGVRDIVPLAVPLMAGSLDRSITMAEALESRGFGAAAGSRPSRRLPAIAQGASLTLVVLALYLFTVGQPSQAAPVLLLSALALVAGVSTGRDVPHVHPTRYRAVVLTRHDALIAFSAVLTVVLTGLALYMRPSALRYDPYPVMGWPGTELWLIVALSLLLMPAVVAPAGRPDQDLRS